VQGGKYQVAGQRSFNANACGIGLSRISPTMMMSGSARKKASHDDRKIQACLFVDLALAQARLGDFNRVFSRPDFGIRRIEVFEHRMQGRRLA
jgi:hypothetical protein